MCFFFHGSATTKIYTLSLHDALPICSLGRPINSGNPRIQPTVCGNEQYQDRKSTRLNSSHQIISYAVFCLKKKKALVDEAIEPMIEIVGFNDRAMRSRIVMQPGPASR